MAYDYITPFVDGLIGYVTDALSSTPGGLPGGLVRKVAGDIATIDECDGVYVRLAQTYVTDPDLANYVAYPVASGWLTVDVDVGVLRCWPAVDDRAGIDVAAESRIADWHWADHQAILQAALDACEALARGDARVSGVLPFGPDGLRIEARAIITAQLVTVEACT